MASFTQAGRRGWQTGIYDRHHIDNYARCTTDNIVTAEVLQERMSATLQQLMGMKIQELTEEELTVVIKWREEMMSNPKAKVTHMDPVAIDAVADFMIAGVGMPVLPLILVDHHRAATPGDSNVLAG